MNIGTSGTKIIFGRGLPETANDQYLYVAAGSSTLMLYSYNGTYYTVASGLGVTFPQTGKSANVISGTPQVGEELTTDTGTWSGSPTAYYYQWGYYESSVWTDLTGEVAATYTVVAGDLGHFVSCRVFASSAASQNYYSLAEYHQASAVEIV
tara:strand:+ start:438 stop:893 length:456 start_codon:yes stop_codon:yes gene_type:complete